MVPMLDEAVEALAIKPAGIYVDGTFGRGGHRPARTFPAALPVLRLDRIYTRLARSVTPVVLPNRPWSHLSDHKPLLAEIIF